MLDNNTINNILLSVNGIIFGTVFFFIKRFIKRVDDMELDIKDVKEIIPETYVKKDDINKMNQDIKDIRDELPKEYVRKIDFFEMNAKFEAKIDKVDTKLDNILNTLLRHFDKTN